MNQKFFDITLADAGVKSNYYGLISLAFLEAISQSSYPLFIPSVCSTFEQINPYK